MPGIRGLDHVGIIVRDLDAAVERYRRLLGLEASRIEDYGPGLLRIAFLPVGDTQIELIQPLRTDEANARWLRRHGEGVQHLAFRVDDLERAIADVTAAGGRLLTPEPRSGAGGTRIVFMDPADAHGVSVELCAPAEGEGA